MDYAINLKEPIAAADLGCVVNTKVKGFSNAVPDTQLNARDPAHKTSHSMQDNKSFPQIGHI